MQPKEAIYFTFNKFFYDLLEDVQQANEELASVIKSSYKVKNMQSTKNLDLFASSIDTTISHTIVSLKPEELLGNGDIQNVTIAKHIRLGKLVEKLDVEFHSTICCYLYNFMLMKLLIDFAGIEEEESSVLALFNQVMHVLKAIQNKQDYTNELQGIYDEDVKRVLALIDATSPDTCSEEVECNSKAEVDPTSAFENTKIGSMAKEISEELDLSDVKVEKPDDVLKLLSSNTLGSIIGKVGDKIQKKITSGELKQDELMTEAFSMLKMLNGGEAGSIFNKMMKQNNVRVDPSKLRSMGTRDRLRRKLDERKNS